MLRFEFGFEFGSDNREYRSHPRAWMQPDEKRFGASIGGVAGE
ncbi:MAG TPA: hypothetical protein VFH03_07085 [Actinoplanes sp.]|nr:hypothetical protein [Actinoplanes sp.]